jgi:chemotaxis signal transduction protein
VLPDGPPGELAERAAGGGVVLRLGGSRYVLDMGVVAEVVTRTPVTRVPGTPVWLTGVANWRGRILPVVDIRSLLGADMTPLPSSARLLVLAGDGSTVGLVAEAVPGVHAGSLADLAPAPATLGLDAAALVIGQVLDRYGPIGVLDASAILGLRTRLDRRRRSTPAG